jgi:tetratricopeptide (TPR) repeat protein
MAYGDGRGVKRDYAEAVKWYRLAATNGHAEHGHALAEYDLGAMYYQGLGVPQDRKEAAKWFQLAADRGYAEAQYNIGSDYYTGAPLGQDYVQAYKWFSLALSSAENTPTHVYPPVPSDIAVGAKRWRDILESKMTPAQLAEAKRLISAWERIQD